MTHNILLVEDDSFQRRQMVRVLKTEGYSVSESSTGEEAIKVLHKEEVSLVLTDKKMPGKDGNSLLRYIRTNYPNLPVIIMTGHLEETTDPQPDALLIKPFTSGQLKELVRRFTGRI